MSDPSFHPPTLDYNTPLPTCDDSSTPPIDQNTLAAFYKPKSRVAVWLFSSFLISLFTFAAALWLVLDSHPLPKYAYVRWTERFLNGLFYVMLLCQFMAFFRSVISRRSLTLATLTIILLPIYTFPWLLLNENSRVKDGRLTRADTDIKSISNALESFRIDTGQYPTSTQGLRILISNPDNNPLWYGPYLKNIPPLDPWDTPYRYTIPGVHNPTTFDFSSAGPDGVFDTSDDIAN